MLLLNIYKITTKRFRHETLKNRSQLFQNSHINTKVEMKGDEPFEISFEDLIDK
jgi:hypothetical protein